MSVDVFWLEQRHFDVPLSDEWFSLTEMAHLAGLKFPKRRADWRLGRWTAKRAVANLLGVRGDLRTIEIVADATGAPAVLVSGEPAGVKLSLSHREGVAVCALTEETAALGCDLELIEPRSDAFLADYFTPNEQALVLAARPQDHPLWMALLWSAKESALKAIGEGLRMDTRSVEVTQVETDGDGSLWRSLRVHSEVGAMFEGWWYAAEGLVRTLVARPTPAVPLSLTAYVEVTC